MSQRDPVRTIEVKKLDYKYFDEIRQMLYDQFGINMNDSKLTLMESRLNKLLREKNIKSYPAFINYLKSDGTGKAMIELSTHLTTNHTHFNREPAHFDFFTRTALPEHVTYLERQNIKDLRVWCAGCSSGEESYMLAILLAEFMKNRSGWDYDLLATDLSMKVLDIAQKGEYSSERISDLPDRYKDKYFNQMPSGNYVALESLKRHIIHRRFNLMHKFKFRKKMQIILCRNVMIYFDDATKDRLIQKFYDQLVDGGYFFVGHSETFRGKSNFTYISPGVYRKGRAL